MFFAEFAQRLRMIEDPKKGVYSFMMDFLGNCFSKGYTVPLSQKSAQRYFNGVIKVTGENRRITGDNIGAFAAKHMGRFDITRLSEYIKEITKYHTDKKQIIDLFINDIPDLTEENYPEKLAQLCKSLLEKAADNNNPSADNIVDERFTEQNETTDSELTNEQSAPPDLNTLIDKLTDLLSKLTLQLEADYLLLDYLTIEERKAHIRKGNELVSEFLVHHTSFLRIKTKTSDGVKLKELGNLGDKIISAWTGFEYDYNSIKAFYHHLKEYRELFDEVKDAMKGSYNSHVS